jgi:hypothetical protein
LRLFVSLFQRLQPIYGYASDEWTWEALFNPAASINKAQDDMLSAIRAKRPPPVLFWLNYFSSSFFRQIGDQAMSKVRHRLDAESAEGMFVFLSDDWWNTHVATLTGDGKYLPVW